MTLHFFYSLTTTQIPNFGYIKWTPYVALTSSFLNTGFDQYVRQGMGRKNATKYVEWIRRRQFSFWNLAHVHFMKNERLECEIKVSLEYYSVFYPHHTYYLY